MIRASLLAVLLSSASLAQADTPRSVITWLSDVIDQPAPDPGTEATDPRTAAVVPLEGNSIVTSALDAPLRDGVGTLATEGTGLPRSLWTGTSALRARTLIYATAPGGVPATRNLHRQLLLTEADPPAGAGPSNVVLLARIDALMAAARLEDAMALVRTAGVTDAALFRRAFDIALLTGSAEPWCTRLRDAPQLSPTLPARVYCAALLGDWAAAALTLQIGRDVGDITIGQEALLARFLDPELFEDLPPPPMPSPLTTLDFILRDAVALPRPETLPLAFAIVDANDDAPLRDRLQARERLASVAAIDAEVLFAGYRSGSPAASGGVWDRMAAAQALDRAFALVDAGAVAEALADADRRFTDIRLRPALARAYATQLAALNPANFGPSARHRVATLLLLAGRLEAAQPWLVTNTIRGDRFLSQLADPSVDLSLEPSPSTLEAAIVTGLTATAPPSDDAATLATKLADGEVGEVLLKTIDLLTPGTEVDPGDLAAALYLLRQMGREGDARQIALETLLLLPEA